VGTVSEWVDIDLLDGLAEARPSWSFVLVGPVRVRADRLLRRPNVICLGPRAHDQVGALMSGLDVGLIPYRRAAATEVASPVKLHEYMAYGVPVVSTDLPEVRQFAPPARIASGPEGFLASIDEALREGRQAPRRGPSWDERVERMVQHVVEALAGPRG
jgi:glycosyltransferase involved in cell wall biosynthesis